MRASKLLRLYAGTTSLFLNRRWGGEKKNVAARIERTSVFWMEHWYRKKKKNNNNNNKGKIKA